MEHTTFDQLFLIVLITVITYSFVTAGTITVAFLISILSWPFIGWIRLAVASIKHQNTLVLLAGVFMAVGSLHAESEIRRAIPVEKPDAYVATAHAMPNETGREWLMRNKPEAVHAFELALDETLDTATAYQLPRQGNPYYSDIMERSVGTHDNYETVRVYRRDIFAGYAILMYIEAKEPVKVVTEERL